jgi:DNA-binding Lrp family transcriptional regulator
LSQQESKDDQILSLLFCNSRASLRAIAREVDLGATAVRARINRLIDSQGITRFTTRVNPAAFGFPGMAFFSFQESEVREETRRAMQLIGKPFAQGETIGGRTCFLKLVTMADATRLGRLEATPSLVEVHEVEMKWNSFNRLSTTDLLIVRRLLSHPHARLSEIAEYASVTPKTVSHRLESLLQEGVLAFRIEVDASKLRLVEGYVFVRLGERVPKTTLERIDETLKTGMVFALHQRFDREMVVTYYCAGSVTDVAPALKEIRSLEGVLDVREHIFSRLTFFHDWTFEAIDARTRPSVQSISSQM